MYGGKNGLVCWSACLPPTLTIWVLFHGSLQFSFCKIVSKHSKGSSKVNKEFIRSLPLCPFISSYATLCFRDLRGQQPRPLFAYFRSFQQQFYLKIVNFSKIQTRIVGRWAGPLTTTTAYLYYITDAVHPSMAHGVVVAQLTEPSLPAPEDLGSNAATLIKLFTLQKS